MPLSFLDVGGALRFMILVLGAAGVVAEQTAAKMPKEWQ